MSRIKGISKNDSVIAAIPHSESKWGIAIPIVSSGFIPRNDITLGFLEMPLKLHVINQLNGTSIH
jgi:hypothetical protein